MTAAVYVIVDRNPTQRIAEFVIRAKCLKGRVINDVAALCLNRRKSRLRHSSTNQITAYLIVTPLRENMGGLGTQRGGKRKKKKK